MKFYAMVEHKPRTNRLDFERPWTTTKITRGQQAKIVSANNIFQNCNRQ